MQEYFFPREDDGVKKGKGEGRWARGRRFRGRAATHALASAPSEADAAAAVVAGSSGVQQRSSVCRRRLCTGFRCAAINVSLEPIMEPVANLHPKVNSLRRPYA